MANGKKSGLPEKRTFAKFLFNKDAGTCLGRTAKSWVQIFVFYVIFYTLLALFWLFCLWLFLRTIDYDLPRYYGKGTIIGVNPGEYTFKFLKSLHPIHVFFCIFG